MMGSNHDESDATDWSSSDSEVEDGFAVSEFHGFDDWVSTSSVVAKKCKSQINEGEVAQSNVCIACWTVEGVSGIHPIFKGGLCIKCKVRLLGTMFAVNSKDVHLYCTICGSCPQESATCSNEECYKNYCSNCLDIWTDDSEYITMSKSWICFLCEREHLNVDDEDDDESDRHLKVQPNWRNQILYFYEPCKVLAPKAFNWKREPLRVLSLFDGIGTGMFVLRHLGIKVEVYFAAEVLSAATTVSRTRLGPPLRHVCSVGEISRTRLEAMLPIHLLIGGSPCNDFSAVNRFPKDFYDPKGSTRYFYDYFRILRNLQQMNGNQHVLWLYENVASMPKSYRQRISKHFQCEPAAIDAKDFSPQLRKRLFWGNIPGIYTVPNDQMTDAEMTLNMALIPNSGRKAAVGKVRTLTTNTNSLYQGRMENCQNQRQVKALFPVHWELTNHPRQVADEDDFDSDSNDTEEEERPSPVKRSKKSNKADSDESSMENGDDQVDVLWLPEIEEVFGFPRHYTDVGNLSRSERQKLLGHTWSVPIITFIMSKLKNYTLPATSHLSD